MTQAQNRPPGSSVAGCRTLNSDGSFILSADQFECSVCPFPVTGHAGIHVVADAMIASPTPATSEFIEVVCQGPNWYRSLRYRRNRNVARINVILLTDGTSRRMGPGMYTLSFRLNRPEPGVSISVRGHLTQRPGQP